MLHRETLSLQTLSHQLHKPVGTYSWRGGFLRLSCRHFGTANRPASCHLGA